MARASKLKTEKLADVKALCIEGLTVAQVARRMDMSRNTVIAWKAAAKEDGDDWDAQRAEQLKRSPLSLLNILRKDYWELATGKQKSESAVARADALYKLELMIDRREKRLGSPDRLTKALSIFIEWARDHVTEEQRALLDTLLERFDRAMLAGDVAVEL